MELVLPLDEGSRRDCGFASPMAAYLARRFWGAKASEVQRPASLALPQAQPHYDDPDLVAEIIDSLPALFMIFDRAGHLQRWNRRFVEVSGYAESACRGLPFAQLFRSTSALGRWALCTDDRQPRSQSFEEVLTTRVGREIPFLLAAARLQVGESMMVAIGATDLTEQRRAERRLHRLAYFDPNTRLPNRLGFPREVSALIEQHGIAIRSQLAVAVVDIHRFQAVNDMLGYQGGDELLREIAARLRSQLEPEEFAAYLGEDSFAVLLWNVHSLPDAERAGERVLGLFQRAFQVRGESLSLSVCVGVAPAYLGGDPVSWLRNANHAMHGAKQRGPGSVVVFADAMRLASERRLKLENELRAAIGHDELCVYLQPIVQVADLRRVGFEALLRWEHPSQGLVFPADFVPLAEGTSLISAIDGWMLYHCVGLAEGLPPGQFININASARSLRSESWVAAVEKLARSRRLAAGCLRVEITESALMGDVDLIRSNLDRLSRIGITTVLDDFGTGYSALAHLRNFPIAGIKIDRSFVTRIDIDARDRRIVYGITSLAHELGLSVTAEGVETESQLQCLREIGCDLAQGYLFGRAEAAGLVLGAEARPAGVQSRVVPPDSRTAAPWRGVST